MKEIVKDLALEQAVGHHHALGTSITLQIFGTQDDSLIQKSFKLIDHYEDILTVNRDESEVMDTPDRSHCSRIPHVIRADTV